jgi:hypothetical protein
MPRGVQRGLFVPDHEYPAMGKVTDHRCRFDVGAMPVVEGRSSSAAIGGVLRK